LASKLGLILFPVSSATNVISSVTRSKAPTVSMDRYPEVHALHEHNPGFGRTPSGPDSENVLLTDPPDTATNDLRPTRRYQSLLLLSGFLMIFHVIGINSVFAIFQVSIGHRRRHRAEASISRRNFIPPLRVILSTHRGRMLSFHLLGLLGAALLGVVAYL
jgi:hypothetical protein